MHIRDYTAQTQSERLNDYVGRVVRHHDAYYLILDCAGEYGWVNLDSGQAHLTDSASDLLRMLDRAEVMPTATLTIGDPQ